MASDSRDKPLKERKDAVNWVARFGALTSPGDHKSRLWYAARADNAVTAFAVLADGRLASASADKTIKLWNLVSGTCEATLEGHADRVTALAVLADGRLASGSGDKAIRIWEWRDQRWTGSVQFVVDAQIDALAMASHASVLAAGDQNGRIHFLKIEGFTRAAGRTPQWTR